MSGHSIYTFKFNEMYKLYTAEIEEPIMKDIRYLDKLVDELAKGKMMDKILRK